MGEKKQYPKYKRAWYLINKERILKTRKENHHSDREETLRKKVKYILENPERIMLHRVRSRAKKYNIQCELKVEDIVMPTHCPILGIPILVENAVHGKKGPKASSPSIDRIDNTKGYTKENTQIISNQANIMKNNATPKELLKFAYWIIHTYGH